MSNYSADEQYAVQRYFSGNLSLYKECRDHVISDIQLRSGSVYEWIAQSDSESLRGFCHEFLVIFLTLGWYPEHELLEKMQVQVCTNAQDQNQISNYWSVIDDLLSKRK